MHTHANLHRKHALAAMAVAASIQIPCALAQVGLGLVPMRQEMQLEAGAQKSGILSVSNDSSARTRVRAELLDFFIDSSEIPQFGRAWPDEAPYSCRSWLSLNPMELELEPGAQARVRYTLRAPPKTTEGGYHCAAGFTTLPSAAGAPGSGLRMAVRVVAAFYVVVGAPVVAGGVKEVRLEQVPGETPMVWRGVVVIENRGPTHFRVEGELAILDADGAHIESSPFLGIPVLPRREQSFLFPLKNPLAPGKYSLRVRLDIGGAEIQEAKVAVEVPSSIP
jgi:hypothetical protein